MRTFLLSAALAIGCAQEPAAPDVRVVVYQTADLHGRAEALPRLAGFLKRRARIDERDGARVVRFDGGDFFQGTPEGDLTRGQLILDALNLMDYSALCLGNHDFDIGAEALEALAKRARFSFLGANVRGASFVRPSLVVHGIEFVGLVPAGMARLGNADTGFTFADEAATLKRHPWKQAARVAITHIGIERDRTLPDAGLCAILGGHSHVRAVEKIAGVKLMHCGAQGTHVGRLEVTLDARTGSVRSSAAEVLEVQGPEDAEVRALIDRGRRPEWDRPIGRLKATLPRGGPEWEAVSSPLGNHLCDALLGFTKADLCLLPRTGLRRPLAAGEVTWRHVYEAYPFPDDLITVRMTGGQVQSALDRAFRERPTLEIGGFSLDWEPGAVEGGLEPRRVYTVAASSFLALHGRERRGHGRILDALVEMVRRGPVEKPYENRIRRKLADGNGKR